MPTVAFSGIEAIHKSTITKVRGVKPSKAALICKIQGSAPPLIGTLTLTDGNGGETWQDAAILHGVRRHISNTSPHLVSVTVADRRWKWAKQTISGVYNTRLDDGTVSTTNKKSVKELIEAIFQAMGETVDAAAAPNDLYPPVNWSSERCHRAIHRLLTAVGCTISINYQTNQAVVSKRGAGQALPQTGTEIEPPVVMPSGPAPSKLKAIGAPVLVQSKFKLEAVGIDSDGAWKKVDDLSYKPSGGWADEWPMGFTGVSSASNRALAQATVWRCFAIKEFVEGGFSIPQLPITFSKITQFLPLRQRLLEADKDQNDVQRQNVPVLEGDYWFKSDGAGTVNYIGGWKILDYDYGIVWCETPTFKISSGEIVAPDLYLTVAHHVRDANDGLLYYDKEKQLVAGTATISDAVPELLRTIIRQYSGTSLTGVIDNKSTVDAEADKYLDAMQVRYAPVEPPSSMRYRGFVFPTLDGALAQVTHRFYGGKAETDVSRHYEDDVFFPPESQRDPYAEPSVANKGLVELLARSPASNIGKTAAHSLWGRISGTIDALGSGTLRIWRESSGTMTDSSVDITVYDRLLATGETWTDKWRVRVEWDSDRYYIVAAACAADSSSTVWGT
jgi:hypothetical protein